MNQSELATLFHSHVDSVITILFGYFSVTSAFLIAAYLVGRELPSLLSKVFVFLYSFTAIALIGMCERHVGTVVLIRDELKALDADWHLAVVEPQMMLPVITYSIAASMALVYIASVWYYYRARRDV